MKFWEMNLFSVRFDQDTSNVEIFFNYEISTTSVREFQFNRHRDEVLSKTFEKIRNSIAKNATKKKRKATEIDEFDLKISLHNHEGQLVLEDTLNAEAWRENYKIKFNERVYIVNVDLPFIKKISLPKVMIAGMPAVISVEMASELVDYTKYLWYTKAENEAYWKLIGEGVNKRMCILENESENKNLRIVGVPSDGNREGLPYEVISTNEIRSPFNIDKLPMTGRHKHTASKLNGNALRVGTYNLLSHAYCDTNPAKNTYFPYCPIEFLDFQYRRVLLTHEIINYNADVLFLQECDESFFKNDLKTSLGSIGYDCFAVMKGEAKEGEAIVFRKDRFRFVKSYDIRLTEEFLLNSLYDDLWSNIKNNDEDMKSLIENRNTVLQVVLVESIENTGSYLLLANTHFYYHRKADFIRLLQAIICAKHIEKLLHQLKSEGKEKVSVLFAGDFNSSPNSYAVNYLSTQHVPYDMLSRDHQKLFSSKKNAKNYVNSLNLSTYTKFRFTNFVQGFQCILDYIFYETNQFELTKVVRMPAIEQITENVALPNEKIPSDHLAVIFELLWKNK